MRFKLRRYPAYSDSSLPWLGQMPTHWECQRAKNLFSESVLPVRGHDRIITCFRDGQVTLRENRRSRGFMTAFYETGYQGVRKGQLVIHAMDAFAGAIGVSDSDGKCTPEYVVCDPKSPTVVPEYYARLLRVMAQQDYIRLLCSAVRERAPRFRFSHFKDQFFPVPNLGEQAAIVRFLNHADRKIGRFIQAKRRLIELLNEQKQAVIQRAVLRGLSPDVRLKPTGVSCLGDIPDSWEQLALVRLSIPRVERNPGGLPLLSVFLDRGVIRYEDGGGQVHAPSIDLSNYQVVEPTDFVLNNQQAWRGSVGISRYHGIISPAYIVLSLSPRLHPEFANYLFRSPKMVDQYVTASKGVGDIQRQVYWPFLRLVQVPVPSLSEQIRIVKFLESELAEVQRAQVLAEREASLIREYRTRLIADIVTGKLDVREVANRLPSSAEQETLDDGILHLSAIDPEDADGLDDDPELLPVAVDEE